MCVAVPAAWLSAPRFHLTGVALLDDWWSVVVANPHSFVHMLRILLVSFAPDPGGRFRPAIAFWSYVEWQSTGAPGSVVGAHVIEAVRLAFFLGVIGVVAAIAARRARPAAHVSTIVVVALIPPAVVLASSSLDAELFARSGPQEPDLVAECLAGGLLILWTLRRRVEKEPFSLIDIVGFGVGYVLLTIGALEQEVSPALLVLGALAVAELGREWREQGIIDRPLASVGAFRIIALAAILPFLREAIGVLLIFARGNGGGVYTSTTTASGSLVRTSMSYFANAWPDQHELTIEFLALVLVNAVLLFVMWRRRQSVRLELAFLVTGLVLLVLESTGADAAPRYALPAICLLAIACAGLVARTGTALMVVATPVVALLLAQGVRAHGVVASSTDVFEGAILTLQEVDRYNPRHCPVYMASMDGAAALAFPRLAGASQSSQARPCATGAAGVLLTDGASGPSSWADERILQSCAAPGWEPAWQRFGFTISTCRRFRTGRVAGQTVRRILSRDRLEPGNYFLPPKQL